jgi:ABC-type transporter Mla MlaB component
MSFVRGAGLYVEATRGGPPLVPPDHSPTSAPGAGPAASSAAHVILGGPIHGAALAGLCERVRVLLEGGAGVVVCDVGGLSEAGVAAISALARLQLTAQRLGGRVQVRNASPELHDLLSLAGLCGVVGACPPLAVEALGQAEEGEELLGVEEERDPPDPVP